MKKTLEFIGVLTVVTLLSWSSIHLFRIAIGSLGLEIVTRNPTSVFFAYQLLLLPPPVAGLILLITNRKLNTKKRVMNYLTLSITPFLSVLLIMAFTPKPVEEMNVMVSYSSIPVWISPVVCTISLVALIILNKRNKRAEPDGGHNSGSSAASIVTP